MEKSRQLKFVCRLIVMQSIKNLYSTCIVAITTRRVFGVLKCLVAIVNAYVFLVIAGSVYMHDCHCYVIVHWKHLDLASEYNSY